MPKVKHPKKQTSHPLAPGRKHPSEIRQEFLDTFPTRSYISLTDLQTYFSTISHSHQSDKDFINAIIEPWNLNNRTSTAQSDTLSSSYTLDDEAKIPPPTKPHPQNWGTLSPVALKRDTRVVNKRYEPLMDYSMDMVGVEGERERERKKLGRMKMSSSVELSVEVHHIATFNLFMNNI